MTIKLKDITPAPWNTRGEITPESVKELAQSIKEQGLITPISVWNDGSGSWICIAGNRRLAALLSIGANDAECVEFKGDERAAKMVTVTENLQREDVSPIEEASLVAECLDAGMTAEAVAAKTGRSVSWVNRRRRLIGLCDEFKSVAHKFTADQLEKIASFDVEAQRRVAGGFDADEHGWEWVKLRLQAEARDLANAKFDTSACGLCLKRTGAQADLWGVCDGCLGQCQDRACFEAKVNAAREAKISELTKCAKEIVRVSGYWEMPREEDSSAKASKKHPCAYVLVDWQGEVSVRFGASKKEMDERAKKEREDAEAKRAEERASNAREDAITDALDAWKNGEGDADCCAGLVDLVAAKIGEKFEGALRDFVSQAVIEQIDTWHDGSDWARVIRAFPEISALAGVSDEDAEHLIGKHADENENEY